VAIRGIMGTMDTGTMGMVIKVMGAGKEIGGSFGSWWLKI